MRCNKIALFFLVLIMVSSLRSQTTGTFLKFSNNSRMLSLGGTHTSLNDGINGITNNPASLNEANNELIFNRTQIMADISYNSFLAGFNTKTKRIGFILSYTDSGEIEGRDINRNRTTSFRSTDKLIGINYTLDIDRESAFGINIKYVLLNIADEEAKTITFDAGYQRNNVIKNLNIGFAIKNLGGRIRFYDNSEKLPLNLNLGVSYRITGGFLIVGDISRWVYEKKTDFSIGSEYEFMNNIYLRCGYGGNDKYLKSFKYGIGMNTGRMSISYAFIPGDKIRDIQSLTLGAAF
jgi:hypothetical protein